MLRKASNKALSFPDLHMVAFRICKKYRKTFYMKQFISDHSKYLFN